MFCLLDYDAQLKSLGMPSGLAEDPVVFGRTYEEKTNWLNRSTTIASDSSGVLSKDTIEATMSLDPRESINLNKELDKIRADLEEPPTTMEIIASGEFKLTFTVPGHIREEVRAAVYAQMKEFFLDSARFMLNTKKYGRYIADPDQKQPLNPMQHFI